jgi:hypothetical protein
MHDGAWILMHGCAPSGSAVRQSNPDPGNVKRLDLHELPMLCILNGLKLIIIAGAITSFRRLYCGTTASDPIRVTLALSSEP